MNLIERRRLMGKAEVPFYDWERLVRVILRVSNGAGEFVLPEEITQIKTNCFSSRKYFTTGECYIPPKVQVIGASAFQDMGCFSGAFEIPEGVTVISNMVLRGLGTISWVWLPSTVTEIQGYTFYNFTITGGIVCRATTPPPFTGGGISGNKNVPVYVPDESVAAYQSCADGWAGRTFLPLSELPETATHPEVKVRKGDDGWRHQLVGMIDPSQSSGEVRFPSGITTVGQYAFYGCSGFSGNLVIPEGVTSIGSSAFNGCSGFSGNLVIPEGVTSIGSSAFSGCSGFSGNLVIPEGVTSIGSYAFNGCSGFSGNLVIPEGVTSIGQFAFNGCSGFSGNLVIPEGVTSIGSYAFNGCRLLASVIVNATTPPTLASSNAFNNTNNVPIYVPDESIDAYKAASGWSTHASRIKPMSELPTT